MSTSGVAPATVLPPAEIALVDDHQLVALAVKAALSTRADLRLTGGFSTVEGLLTSGFGPGLVLLDLRLADGSSPGDNVRRLRRAGHAVVAFTSGEDLHLIREALRAEVLGLVRKSSPIPVIVAAITAAARGEPIVTSEWAHAVDGDPRLQDAGLSTQEARVLGLFADGATSQAVAEDLHITVGTLEDYVRRIRTKYSRVGRPAPTKVDLYKRAVEDGLLPGPTRA